MIVQVISPNYLSVKERALSIDWRGSSRPFPPAEMKIMNLFGVFAILCI